MKKPEFSHPLTSPSRPPGCVCGHPLPEFLPGSSSLLFRAVCCFALYRRQLTDEPGEAFVLSLVREGPERLPPGVCDGCGTPSLELWDASAPPEFTGISLCRECMEGGVGGIPGSKEPANGG